MGNVIGGKKRRTAKVMKLDGTTIRLKLPAQAGDVLRDHPEHNLLEAEEVKRLGVRAQPLEPDQAIKPGKLYFLVEIPRLQHRRLPRRAWSGAIHMSAKDRLETLMLSRRTASDISLAKPPVEAVGEGGVRIRMRLPKAQVAQLVEESADGSEAAEKIIALCAAADGAETSAGSTAVRPKEKRTRFVSKVDVIRG